VTHNGENETEEKRVKELGVTINGSYITPPAHSGFAFAQLAVTRALGHKYFSKYGVIPDPEFAEFQFQKSDRYLVLSSDGVSDILRPDEIFDNINMWAKSSNLEEVTKKLVKLSLETWETANSAPTSSAEMPDNTTALIIDLQKIGIGKN